MTKPDFVRECYRQATDEQKVTSAHIYNALGGQAQNLTSNYLTLFAQVLGCSRDDFFETVEEEKK